MLMVADGPVLTWFCGDRCHKTYDECRYPLCMYTGMQPRKVMLRVDDSVTDFETIPGEWTKVWTDMVPSASCVPVSAITSSCKVK